MTTVIRFKLLLFWIRIYDLIICIWNIGGIWKLKNVYKKNDYFALSIKYQEEASTLSTDNYAIEDKVWCTGEMWYGNVKKLRSGEEGTVRDWYESMEEKI